MPSTLQLVCPAVTALELDMTPLSIPTGPAVINSTFPFSVDTVLTIGGLLAPLVTLINIPVTYTVSYESIGPGAEAVLGVVNFNLNAGFVPSVICPFPNHFDYALSLAVPIGTLNAVLNIPLKIAAVIVPVPASSILVFDDGLTISST